VDTTGTAALMSASHAAVSEQEQTEHPHPQKIIRKPPFEQAWASRRDKAPLFQRGFRGAPNPNRASVFCKRSLQNGLVLATNNQKAGILHFFLASPRNHHRQTGAQPGSPTDTMAARSHSTLGNSTDVERAGTNRASSCWALSHSIRLRQDIRGPRT
jgi:hypothetical protein